MFFYIYLVSVTYCLWRVFKSYKRTSMDGVTGTTPGLETLAIIVFAPVLAIVDITLIWIRIYKEAEEAKRRNNDIF